MAEETKVALETFELPCGHLEGDKILNKVTLREMTGNEEDLLAQRNVPFLQRMNQVLANCTERLFGDDGASIGKEDKDNLLKAITGMVLGDRVFLMFALRMVSIGEDYSFKVACPNCGKELLRSVNLKDLGIKKSADPKKRLFDITLPSGKMAKIRVMTGADEEKIDAVRNEEGDVLSAGIMVRVVEIDKKPPSMEQIKNMSLKDRNMIRKETAKLEGGLDTSVAIKCNNCRHNFEADVDIAQASFFFPAET